MKFIKEANIILIKVQTELTKQELETHANSAIYTKDGWMLIDTKGNAYQMYIVSLMDLSNNHWVLDKDDEGPYRIIVEDGKPMRKGKFTVTKETLETAKLMFQVEGKPIEVGDVLHPSQDMRDSRRILATTNPKMDNVSGISMDFLGQYILSGWKIESVVARYDSQNGVKINWEDHYPKS